MTSDYLFLERWHYFVQQVTEHDKQPEVKPSGGYEKRRENKELRRLWKVRNKVPFGLRQHLDKEMVRDKGVRVHFYVITFYTSTKYPYMLSNKCTEVLGL